MDRIALKSRASVGLREPHAGAAELRRSSEVVRTADKAAQPSPLKYGSVNSRSLPAIGRLAHFPGRRPFPDPAIGAC